MPNEKFDPDEHATARDAVLAYLRYRGHPTGPKEIAEAVGASDGYVRQLLGDMLESGVVVKPRHGRYHVPAASAVPTGQMDIPELDARARALGVSEAPAAYGEGRAILIEATTAEGAVVGWDMNSARWVQLGEPARVRLDFRSALSSAT